jgi:DNA-binding NtrC family response regulator
MAAEEPGSPKRSDIDDVTPISLDDRLRELEASLIVWALRASNGNKSRAAVLLRVKRSTLGDRIARCGIDTRRSGEAVVL